MRVRFEDSVAGFDARELLPAGKPVHVEPRAPRLLELLIAARAGTAEMTVRRYAGAVSTQSVRRP